MLLAKFADEVRAMAPGDVVTRCQRSPVADWRNADLADGRSFNAYVTKLRASTGFALSVETLPPHLSDNHVLRCYTVTRTA